MVHPRPMPGPAGGGSYVRQTDGSLTRVEDPPDEHPAGNAPRGADGRLMDAPPVAAAVSTWPGAPAATNPDMEAAAEATVDDDRVEG